MKRILAFLIIITTTFFNTTGQEVLFKVEITNDTLYYGNTLGVKFTVENAQGDFEPPEFEGFDLVGGPNVSSQFSMVNGQISQSASYEYFLVPRETGVYVIPPAILKQENNELLSNSIQVVVVENPEGIRQRTGKYKKGQELIVPMEKKKMTKKDSLLLKLKKIKAKKI